MSYILYIYIEIIYKNIMKGKTMKSERISVCKLILFIMAVIMMFSYRVFAFEGGDEDTGGEIVITSTGAVIADTTDGQLVNSYNAADNTWSGNHGNAIWDDDNKTVSFCIRAEILFGSTYACESKHGTPWHHYRGHTALMIKNPEYNPTQEISENNKEYVYVPNTKQKNYLIRQKGTPTNADYTNTGMQTINFSHIDLKNYIIKNDRSFYVLNKGFTGNTQNMSDNNIGTAYASCEVNFGHIELGVFSFLDGLFGYTRSSVANTLSKWSAATGYDDVSDVAFHHIYIDDPICTYHYDFDTDPGDKKITSGIIYDKQKDEDASPSTFSEIVSKDKIGQYCHITFYTESGMYQNVTIEITQGVNVDFNLNGAEGTAPGPFYVTLNDTDILFPDINEDVFYNYYNFCGWSEKPLRIYEADEEIPKDIYTVYQNLPQLTEDITYYAVWQKGKVSVNIKFYLNGVLLNDYPDYITIDGNITDTSGHTQKADKNSLIRFDKGSVINLIIKGDEDIFYISSDNPEKQTDYRININEQILKDTTYTLKFGTIHTVKYDMNGGRLHEPTLDEKKYFGTNLTILKNIPERTGYEFSYYEGQGNYEKDENKLYNPKDKYIHNQKGGTDIIKAVWEPVTYNITFNPNKPVEASTEIKGKMPDNITLTYDAPYTLPDNRYKLAGWVFMEWNTKPDGSGDSYNDKASIKNLSATQGDTITLYAQWKVTYKIVGSLNGIVSENFTDGNRPYGKITEGKMIRNNAVAAYKDGDCTGDGRLTEKDAELIEKFLNNEVTPSDKQKTAMDVNGDGSITSADKNQVLRLIDELTLTASKNNVFKLSSSEYWCHDYPGYKISASIKCTTDDVYIMGINNEKYNNTSTTNVEISEKTINTTYTDTIRFGTIHTISFKPNDSTEGNGSTEATNMPDDITKYYDKDIKIPNAPKRDGYNFKGWTSDKTPDKIYQPGDIYNYAQRGGTDTLTAQWDNNI